jgi:DNA-binding CsgD family transcriptional regulator/tetratricopeptide (TPR) repeat protein
MTSPDDRHNEAPTCLVAPRATYLTAPGLDVAETASMPLIEREVSCELLAGYAAESGRGEGRLVLVSGEAGAGKSALVDQAQQDLPDARWAWGMCDGLFTPRPLAPLYDLAGQLGGPLLELCGAGAGRDELFRALLSQISAPGSLNVVVVEDIHWADDATLDLLRFLARRLRGVPAMVIATYRDDDLAATEPLRVALGDLATQRSARRIELAPLSADAVRTLAAGSALAPAELYRLTGGNPFYLTEVLQAGTDVVPTSARDAVLARATRLGGAARAALDAAALIGTRMELRLLRSVAGCATSTVDDLLASGLLVGDGGWLRFRHEIARLAVEQAVTAHRGVDIHRRILDSLRSLGYDDDAGLAFHAEAAGDTPAVVRHAPSAARRAAALASHREAAAQFQRALRCADEVDPALVAAWYDGLTDELSLLGRFDEAAAACERALALWREVDDRLREGDTLRRLSRIMWNLCRDREAITAVETAVALLEPLGPTVELARANATFANRLMLCAEYDASRDVALLAQSIAEQIGDGGVLSDTLITQAVCASHSGRDWVGQLHHALDLALAGNHHEQAARAYANFAGVFNSMRDYAEAERYITAGLTHCDEHDLADYGAFLRGERANAREQTGRWEESVAMSLDLLADAGPCPSNQVCALRRVGTILARWGDTDAWTYLDRAATFADRSGEPANSVPVRLARAEAHWLEGRPADAAREAERADDESVNANLWERGAIAVWLLRTGSTRPVPGELAEPYRLQLGGDWAKAAEAWISLGCPYEAAMTLTDAAQEASLRDALTILTRLNAPPMVRIVRRKLQMLGARTVPVGPRTATRAHPLGLTRREQEILRLICARLTNTEIARTLFIATKTVDRHVSAILTKLGTPTRTAAAERAAQLGLHDPRDTEPSAHTFSRGIADSG